MSDSVGIAASHAPNRRAAFPARQMLAVALAALAVRAIFILQWQSLPYADSPLVDAKVHEAWAAEILGGHPIRAEAFYQSPFYPYFLAAVYAVFGHHPALVLWIQAAAGAAACVVLGLVADLCFGAQAGLLAGLAAALYAPYVFHGALLGKEPWVILGLACACWLALRAAAPQAHRREAFLCGLALGFTALSRGNVLFLVPVVPVWWLFTETPKRPARALLFCLGVALPILPATIHNYAASRDFVLVNYTGGYTVFMGSNPEATGTGTSPLGIPSEPHAEEAAIRRIAEKEAGRPLKPSEVSSWWAAKGMAFARENSGAWTVLVWKRFRLFWSGYEAPDTYDQQFVAKKFGTAVDALPGFAAISVLGLPGLLLLRRRDRPARLLAWLAAGYVIPVVVLFYVCDRYRLPATVFLIPAAAGMLSRLVETLRRRQLREAAVLLGAAVPAAVLAWGPSGYPLPPGEMEARAFSQLGAIHQRRARLDEAMECYRQAIALDPMLAEARNNFGTALHARGRAEEAMAEYREALRLRPAYAEAHVNLGLALAEREATDEAAMHYRTALETDPGSAEAHDNWGGLLLRQGRIEEAELHFRAAIGLAPGSAQSRSNLGVALARQGRLAEAIAECRAALEADPESALARDNLRILLELGGGH